jgi:hypothetical protein
MGRRGIIFQSQWRVNILGSSGRVGGGQDPGIVTAGLEIELAWATTVLYDVAVGPHNHPTPPQLALEGPHLDSWRDQLPELLLIGLDTTGWSIIWCIMKEGSRCDRNNKTNERAIGGKCSTHIRKGLYEHFWPLAPKSRRAAWRLGIGRRIILTWILKNRVIRGTR